MLKRCDIICLILLFIIIEGLLKVIEEIVFVV